MPDPAADASTWSRRGARLLDEGRVAESTASLLNAAKLAPDRQANANALIALGGALEAAGEPHRALRAYARAVRLEPGSGSAYFSLGIALGREQRIDQASAALGAATLLAPADAVTHRALAIAESMRGRHAVAARSLRTALRLNPAFEDAHFELGVALQALGSQSEAVACYRALLARWPRNANALANHGTALRDLGRARESAAAYEAALRVSPGFPEVYNNLGLLLASELRQPSAALRVLADGRALPHTRSSASIDWSTGFGLALSLMQRHAEAAAAFEAAFAATPGSAEAACYLVRARGRVAHWRGFDGLMQAASAGLRRGECKKSWDPLYGLALPLRTPLLRELAIAFAERKRGLVPLPLPPEMERAPVRELSRARGGMLRVGYLSADYRRHVMGFLTLGMLEEHAAPSAGRPRDFDVYALALSPEDGSGWRSRFVDAVNGGARGKGGKGGGNGDRFIDLSGDLDPLTAARKIRRLGLHLIVDLNGYTTDERSDILALRPAAVATHAVGYPGTTGAAHVPYIVLDRVAAPPNTRAALTERLVLQPHCYQVNDHQRLPPHERVSSEAYELGGGDGAAGRAAAGRPLLVNFNQLYKVSRAAAEVWCGALARLPRAALWLLRHPADGESFLRAEAAACGLAHARRLIFGALVNDIGEHLTRTARADLLVDTLEYNCHTTGSDALWSGVPALTVAGEQMASRVGASLVRASGLAHAQVHGLRQYQDSAVALVGGGAAGV